MYDKDRQHTEFGIDPDVEVGLTDESAHKNIDDIIEKARKLLVNS